MLLTTERYDGLAVRVLTSEDAEDFKHLRLEALAMERGAYLADALHDFELSACQWKDRCRDGGRIRVLGLSFGTSSQLIGITGFQPCPSDSSGRTALFRGTYVQRPFRGLGYGHLLNKCRYAMAQQFFSQATVVHGVNNAAAIAITRSLGGVLVDTISDVWTDGKTATGNVYRVPLCVWSQ